MRVDQAVGLLCAQPTGNFGANVVLEVASGRTGQRAEDAVHGPLVVTQTMQCILDLPPVSFGHVGLGGQPGYPRSWRRCGRG